MVCCNLFITPWKLSGHWPHFTVRKRHLTQQIEIAGYSPPCQTPWPEFPLLPTQPYSPSPWFCASCPWMYVCRWDFLLTLWLACMHAKSLQSCLTLWPYGQQPVWLLCPWGFSRQDTGVGCHALLQSIFPTQGLNLCLLPSPALAGQFFTASATWEAA